MKETSDSPGHRLGLRVRELRRARGLTQVQLSRQSSVSQPYLSRLERGVLVNPAASLVARLAGALKVPVPLLYARPGAESLALRAELQVRVKQAMDPLGDELREAERAGTDAVSGLLEELGPGWTGLAELEEWGRRLVVSHVSLRRLALLERRSREPGRSIPLAGRFDEAAPGKGALSAAAEIGPHLPEGTLALLLERDGLLPGARRGDMALYAPQEAPKDGDLALVEVQGAPCIRRVFFGGEGQVVLVPAAGAERPDLLPGHTLRVLGRFTGLIYRSTAQPPPA